MHFSHATASRIKTYRQCEFRYFLEYQLQYPPMRKDNIYSGKGSAVHEALEGWTNWKLGVPKTKDGPYVEEDWEETLRKYYEKSKLWELDARKPDKGGFPHPVEKTCESCPWASKDDRCLIANKATGAVDGCPRPNFQSDVDLVKRTLTRTDYSPLALDEDGNFVRKIIGAEVQFDTELGGVRVRGVIDLVAEDDSETIEIIDYKTGRSMSYRKAFDDPQVRIYAAVARLLWPQYKFVMVTLHYLKKYPVTVPLSVEDDELTIRSLQRAQNQILENKEPARIMPTRYGFPCDWCIGRDTCGEIKEKFKVNGRFQLPTISCSFADSESPCRGGVYPVKNQEVNVDNVNLMVYSCKAHAEVNDGKRERSSGANDSDKTHRQDKDTGKKV